MRYFYAALALSAAVMITLKPELTSAIVSTGLVVAGLMTLLPTESLRE